MSYPGFQARTEVRPEFKAMSPGIRNQTAVPCLSLHLCFRQLCLRRWASCKAFPVVVGTQTWRQYYFCRSELEFRVASGRPRDFTSKAISGHTGTSWRIVAMSTPTAHPLSGQISGILVSQLLAWLVLLDNMWVPLGAMSSVLCYRRKE